MAMAKKILLVDDDPLNLDILARRLKRNGYQVITVADGAAAVAQARAELPDLILMDFNLPKLDGWRATKQIKADAASGNIPVIGLTALALAGDRERALAAGCDDYESKPIEFPRLLAKIQKLIDLKEGNLDLK